MQHKNEMQLCILLLAGSFLVRDSCGRDNSVDSNAEATLQASAQEPHAPPIPPAGPLAEPRSLKQVGVPVEVTRAVVPADNPQSLEKIALGEKIFSMDVCRRTELWLAVHAMIQRSLSRMEDLFRSASRAVLASAMLPQF